MFGEIRPREVGEMEVDVALIEEQGVRFAVVAVVPAVTASPSRSAQVSAELRPCFDGAPVVLMSKGAGSRARPTYRGRHDLVRFLASVPYEVLPWRRAQISLN